MTQQPLPTATEVFAGLRDRLLAEHPEDSEGRMLHAPGLRTGGSFYAFVSATDVMMKLPADRVAQLVDAGDGRPCSPRPGRPMREWVCVPAVDEDRCMALVSEARAFVASLVTSGEDQEPRGSGPTLPQSDSRR